MFSRVLLIQIAFIFCLLFFSLSAASSNIDSLLARLDTLEKRGENQVLDETYLKLVKGYQKNMDYRMAVIYCDKALELTENAKTHFELLEILGKIYVDSTNYKLALKYLDQAISEANKMSESVSPANCYNMKGMCYGLTNDLTQAIIEFKIALDYNIKFSDSVNIGYNYYNIGLANYLLGQYDKAIEFYIRSVNVREQIGDTANLVASLTSVGEVFRIKKDYKNAKEYYERVIKLKSDKSRTSDLAYLYSELALIYKIEKNYKYALVYIDTAMDYSVKAKYKRGIATLLSYKAGIFRIQGDTNRAIVLYNETINKYKEIGYEPGLIQSKLSLAEISYEQKDYKTAVKLLNDIEIKAVNNNLLDEQKNIAELKYKLHKALNNYKKALLAHEKYMLLNDSIFNIDKEKSLAEIDTKYQTAKKEKQIANLNQENQLKEHELAKRNNLIITIVIVSLLIVLILILLFRHRQLRATLSIEQNQQKLLRSQMNPHFMYNALGAIQNFILQNNPVDSATYISDFSSLMRLVLEGSRQDFIILEDDIKLANAYLKLQQLRFNSSFNYTINTDADINTQFEKIPPMLSQPFIENAVEHGMRNLKEKDGLIEVYYKKEKEKLKVIISDNGGGFQNEEKNKKHKSLATKITAERIVNIKKLHNIQIDMEISGNNNKGTTVTITVNTPL